MNLAAAARPAYSCLVLATAGIGFSSSSSKRRVAPDRAFFYALSHHLNGGLRGEISRSAGVLLGRSANPASVRHYSFSSECGGLQILRGAAS